MAVPKNTPTGNNTLCENTENLFYKRPLTLWTLPFVVENKQSFSEPEVGKHTLIPNWIW